MFPLGRIAVFTLMHITSGVTRLTSGRAQLGLLTVLLECLTVLFKYFDLFQYQWQGHSKHLGGLGPWQAQPWLHYCMPHISFKFEEENLVNLWNSPKYFPTQFVCICTGPCCDSIYLMQGDD